MGQSDTAEAASGDIAAGELLSMDDEQLVLDATPCVRMGKKKIIFKKPFFVAGAARASGECFGLDDLRGAMGVAVPAFEVSEGARGHR
jgi:hypothetical protein